MYGADSSLSAGKRILPGAYVSVLAGWCSFKIRLTHRSIDDTLIQPKFVG